MSNYDPDNLIATAKSDLIEVKFDSVKHDQKRNFVFINKPIQYHSTKKMPIAGSGSCRACDCRGYISKHNGSHECKTCSHHYDRHN